jgi:hypothetical protein
LLIYASSRCCWSVVDIVVITTQQSTINGVNPLVVVLQVALQAVVIDGRCWVDDEIGEPGMQVVNEIILLEGGAANPHIGNPKLHKRACQWQCCGTEVDDMPHTE